MHIRTTDVALVEADNRGSVFHAHLWVREGGRLCLYGVSVSTCVRAWVRTCVGMWVGGWVCWCACVDVCVCVCVCVCARARA